MIYIDTYFDTIYFTILYVRKHKHTHMYSIVRVCRNTLEIMECESPAENSFKVQIQQV